MKDQPPANGDSTEADTEVTDDSMDESKDPLEESGGTADDGDQEVDQAVLDDMERFEASFENISQRYRLINRIGEGTFSTVYKAEDLLHEHYQNDWDIEKATAPQSQTTSKPNSNRSQRRPRYVAIKRIYVTSSPARILNELELLHDLRDSPHVCPLITAFRHNDQVIAVLPFFQHRDFREYYRDFSISDIRIYMHTLFSALASVHEAKIIHRDIKPTNFLYSPSTRRGVLVDFGLAEREDTDYQICACCLPDAERQRKMNSSIYYQTITAAQSANQPAPRLAYPANDPRASRRANRAGTRGFRAPEVLLKCTAQTTLIDVWSVGVILLTFLTRRFPFFHAPDDIDAFIELCCVFGRKRTKEVSLLHGQVMHTNLPTLTDNGHGFEKIILWCNNRQGGALERGEADAVKFLKCCLELDPVRRITARDALEHPFLADVEKNHR